MKRSIQALLIVLCACACLMLPGSARAAGVSALGDITLGVELLSTPELTVTDRSESGSSTTLTLAPGGHDTVGTSLVVTRYDADGNMRAIERYDAADSVTVTFRGCSPTDVGRVMWLDARYRPVCEALTVRFNVDVADSWEEMAAFTAALIEDAESGISVEGAPDEYATARLIVRSTGPIPYLSEYNPTRIVAEEDYTHYLIQFGSAADAANCAAYLQAQDYIEYVEPDMVLGTDTGVEVETEAANSWGVSMCGLDLYARDLAARGVSGSKVVAVVDTGVDSTHTFLKGRVLSGGYDFIDNDSRPNDGHGHGTHVSGTVVDATPGLNVKIMAVRVLNSNGEGNSSQVSQGIRYAASHGANVINLSLGGDGRSSEIEDAINSAVKKGVVVCVAAGNKNKDTANYHPAYVTKAITVAAVDSSKVRAGFSNYGSSVDIAAPGVSIRSCVPGGGYSSWDGTSMATPHVSAAAVMLMLDHPTWKPATIETQLRGAAEDLGSTGWDKYYGAGFLNLRPFAQTTTEYTVHYDANGGYSAPSDQTKIVGKTLTLSSAKPTRSHMRTFVDGTSNFSAGTVYATFKSWNTKADGSGVTYRPGAGYDEDASVTLYAQWELPKAGPLPNPVRTGYTLLGWYTAKEGGTKISDDTLITKDVIYYTHWQKDAAKYTVSYSANGGTGAPADQTKTEGVALTLSSTKPTRTHKVTFDSNYGSTFTRNVSATFRHWNTEVGGTGTTYNPGGSYTANASVTLYAQWVNATVGALTTPTRSGYTFLGWYTTAAAGSKISSSTIVTKDVTFYAHWEKIPETYTIHYNANGGTGAPADQTKTEGVTLTLSSTKPTRTFDVDLNDRNVVTTRKAQAPFSKWNTAADGSGTNYSAGGSYTANAGATLYAQWGNATVGTLPTPTREGYTFKGWFTKATGGTQVTASTVVTQNVTFHAQWEKIPEIYTIHFDANGGTGAPSDVKKTEDVTLTLPTARPARSWAVSFDSQGGTSCSGKSVQASFVNWNTRSDGTGTGYAAGGSYTANGNATLYAKWGSGTVGTLPAPTRADYNFLGWYTASSGGTKITASTAVTADVTFYARWEKIPETYTIRYDANGGTGAPASQTKTEGVTLTLSTTSPTREYAVTFDSNYGSAYNQAVQAPFISWNTAANGSGTRYNSGASYTVDAPATLYAQWGSAAVGPLPQPGRPDYNFLGWYTASSGGTKVTSSTAVSGNVTYYAHWEKAHKLTLNYTEYYQYANTHEHLAVFGEDGNIVRVEPGETVNANINVNYYYANVPEMQLRAYLDGTLLDGSQVTWSRDVSYGYGIIDETGRIYGQSSGGFVTMSPDPVTETVVYTAALKSDPTLTATATIHFVYDAQLSFSIADTSIATVNAAGVVTGKKNGATTLTMTSGLTGQKATCQVYVGPQIDVPTQLVIRESGSYRVIGGYGGTEYAYVDKNGDTYLRFQITQAQAAGSALTASVNYKLNDYDSGTPIQYDSVGFYENGYAYYPIRSRLYYWDFETIKLYYQLNLADGTTIHPLQKMTDYCYHLQLN